LQNYWHVFCVLLTFQHKNFTITTKSYRKSGIITVSLFNHFWQPHRVSEYEIQMFHRYHMITHIYNKQTPAWYTPITVRHIWRLGDAQELPGEIWQRDLATCWQTGPQLVQIRGLCLWTLSTAGCLETPVRTTLVQPQGLCQIALSTPVPCQGALSATGLCILQYNQHGNYSNNITLQNINLCCYQLFISYQLCLLDILVFVHFIRVIGPSDRVLIYCVLFFFNVCIFLSCFFYAKIQKK
jgi:hypothetical protein